MSKKTELDRLEKALFDAHRQRPEQTPDANWNAAVMARVEREAHGVTARHRGATSVPAESRSLIWRFAAASGSAALALSAWVLTTGIGPDPLLLLVAQADPLTGPLLQSLPF